MCKNISQWFFFGSPKLHNYCWKSHTWILLLQLLRVAGGRRLCDLILLGAGRLQVTDRWAARQNVVRGRNSSHSLHFVFNCNCQLSLSSSPCAILLCGCNNTVVDRHGSLHRLADWYHHLLLVLLLYHLLVFIPHWYLEGGRWWGGVKETQPWG